MANDDPVEPRWAEAEIDRLRASRAELEDALQVLLKAADNSNCDSMACDAARAALSRARGETP